MKAIICDKKTWQVLENKVYQALVANKVIVPYLNDEKEEVLPLNYSSLRQNPKTGEFAFEVKLEAEKYLTKDELAQAVELDWTWFCGKNQIKGHPVKVWYCAYNVGLSVFHRGAVNIGQELNTGQLTLEWFSTEIAFEDRVDELKSSS